jgi:hypothetical protein
MPKIQFLPSIRDSETVTCRRCSTRQYPKDGACIRCRSALGVDYLSLPIGVSLASHAEDHERHLARWIGVLLRLLRKRCGFRQSELARMAASIDRSYLSKAECGLVLLSLTKLLQLARSLGLTAVILRFEKPRLRGVQKSSCIH